MIKPWQMKTDFVFWNVCIMEKNVPVLYLKSYPLPNQLFLIIWNCFATVDLSILEKMGDGCTTQFQRKGKTVLRICFLIMLKPLIQMVDATAISANNIYIRQSGKIAFLLNAYIDICKSIKLSGG